MTGHAERARAQQLLLACIAATPGLLAVTASAQDTAPGSAATGLEEIVVTARRREESLQQVPSAVTAVTAEELADLQISNLGEVGQTVPNLNVKTQFGSGSAPQFSLRGQDSGLLSLEVDSRIGLYVDGVYLGRPVAAAFDVADLCRLEVMRGPQGTLFGRNSTGGAINFVTCAPSAEFGGHVEVGVGDYNERRLKATLETGESNGLSAKLTYLHHEHDGYVDNERPGVITQFTGPQGTIKSAKDFGREDTDAVGFALRYRGVENLTLDYKFDYTDKENSQLAVQLLGFTDPGIAGLFAASGGIAPSTHRRGSVPLDFMGTGTLEVKGHALTAEYAINDSLSIKNVASYREFEENTGGNDIDGNALNGTILGQPGTRFCFICSTNVREQDQVSDELQLLGSSDSLDWIVGLFYFREQGRNDGAVFIGGLFPPGPLTAGNLSQFVPSDYFAGGIVEVENESRAAYAHADYKITSALELGAGVRYTKDNREEDAVQVALIPPNTAFEADFNYTDWDTSLTYHVSQDVHVYAKVGTAHVSGGVLGGLAFEPEKTTSYELGLKSDLLEQRLRLNVAAFRAEVSNYQFPSFTVQTGTIVINTGESEQQGVELELTAVPIDGLSLMLNYGYLDYEAENGHRPLAPRNTGYFGAEYEFPAFGNGSRLSARVDAAWEDDSFQAPCPVGATTVATGCTDLQNANLALDEAVKQEANAQIGARITLADIPFGGHLSGRVSLWGRNLLDTDELEFPTYLGNGTVVGSFQVPRTYGMDLTMSF
jgi:iron complex outermembrane recepter protein